MVVFLVVMTRQQMLAKMKIQGSIATEIATFRNPPHKRWPVSAGNWQAHEMVKAAALERQKIHRRPEAYHGNGIAAPTYLGVRDATCGSGPVAHYI